MALSEERSAQSQPDDATRAIRRIAHNHKLVAEAPDDHWFGQYCRSLTSWLDVTIEHCHSDSSVNDVDCGWLLDNDYVIRRAIRQIEQDMPPEFLRRLPVVMRHDKRRIPRVLALTHSIVNELHLQLSFTRLVELVNAYQQSQSLSEAELWAFPVMSRLVCLESLRRGSRAINPEQYGDTEESGWFVEKPEEGYALAVNSVSVDSASSLDIANGISALVILSEIDWYDFVDATSQVERLFCGDPSNHYVRLSRETKSAYRKVVEQLADVSDFDEMQVALQAVELARQQPCDSRQAHVGYWLIAEGLGELETRLSCRFTIGKRIVRKLSKHAVYPYGISIAALLTLMASIPIMYALSHNAGLGALIGLALLCVIPASILSLTIVDSLVLRLVPPCQLPQLDVRYGIPSDAQTVVVVPVIIGSRNEASTSIEKLELRHLANPEQGLCYALLSDPIDANQKFLQADDGIEAELIAGINTLNARYGDTDGDRFFLLHRHRDYNESQRCWMAYERKRGKLEQFSALLTEGRLEPFAITEGNLERLVNIQFMITLDADTLLPPGTAVQMVCTIAHPLNRASVNAQTGRVEYGYTVLQPRLETLTPGDTTSLFAKIFAGDCAIDIYSRAVSDVYQDLFGVGSYVGKGIHDVKAFQETLSHRVPDNAILSHDLFEGIHGRVGLATDIILYENYPENWAEYAARQHRWIRGDWQLLPWLGRTVPITPGKQGPSVFSLLDRWKLLDNLRRSVAPILLFLFFLSGWLWLPGSPVIWTLFALGSFAPYLLDEAFSGLATLSRRHKPQGFSYRFQLQATRVWIAVAFLIPDALNALDAIGRTVWRVYVSGNNLLQWTSSAHTSLKDKDVQIAVWRLMWPSPVTAVVVALLLVRYQQAAVLPALPILFSWFIAPWVAVFIGKSKRSEFLALRTQDKQFLQQVARRTWHYFDEFCSPSDHWLPPDNYQQAPGPQLARRTSPTNIGLYLSSIIAAQDLGFIGMRECNVRLRNVMDTLERLQRHRGHWLNWYDTATLEPLEPSYVSTVDSGNLAICLITAKQACLETGDRTLLGETVIVGLGCTYQRLKDACMAIDSLMNSRLYTETSQLLAKLNNSESIDTYEALQQLGSLEWPRVQRQLVDALLLAPDTNAKAVSEIHVWLERFDHHLYSVIRDIDELAPWHRVLSDLPLDCAPLFNEWKLALAPDSTIGDQLRSLKEIESLIEAKLNNLDTDSTVEWLLAFRESLKKGHQAQSTLLSQAAAESERASKFAYEMDFSWLFDSGSRLFHIGYNVTDSKLDTNHYDLLASEARMASYFAIAKHDVPLEHWFHLGRPVIHHKGQPVAQSWNGSMFEYLMPTLFLPGKRDTFLGVSELVAVYSQQSDARKRRVPWGVSESAFAETDAHGSYQYRAFGTTELGIRRGLADDLVIAPYASMLALGVNPKAAVENLNELQFLGALGRYGFVEALDYTPLRNPFVDGFQLVHSWMAHHQGMSLTAVANVLCRQCMSERVQQESSMQAVQLLLQERVPWSAPPESLRPVELTEPRRTSSPMPASWMPHASSRAPQVQLLGNGHLSARVTPAGGGAVFFNDAALTRWHDEATRRDSGYRFHVQIGNDHYWLGTPHATVKTVFANDHVEIIHRTHDLAIRLEVVISAHENVDVRRITVINDSDVHVQVKLTSFAEVVLARALDHERHPAFSKLFVHSRWDSQAEQLVFERRTRHPDDRPLSMVHKLVRGDNGVQLIGHETDRGYWNGRLGVEARPAALDSQLSRTCGWTLDPIMAIQVMLSVPPNASRQCAFLTGAATSAEQAIEQCARISLPGIDQRYQEAAQVAAHDIQRLDIRGDQLPLLQNLASLLLYPHYLLRRVVEQDTSSHAVAQHELWAFGVSGDLPMAMLHLDDDFPAEHLNTLLRAQALWRLRGMHIDLLLIRTGPGSYEEPLRQRVQDSLRDTGCYHWLGRKGGVHWLSQSGLDELQVVRLQSVAQIVLYARDSLQHQLEVLLGDMQSPAEFFPIGAEEYQEINSLERPPGLLYDNGFGGFCPETGDYRIHLEPGEATPAPWCNVLANDTFGTIVSESGLGFSWSINSGEYRLTRWSNDPVVDTPGEILFIRDETTADFWTVTPTRHCHTTAIQVRHSTGSTSWLRNSHGIEQALTVFTDINDPVKCIRLQLNNQSGIQRRLTVTYFADWLLGAVSTLSRQHVRCWYDAADQAILASNGWNVEFAERLSFLTANMPPHSVSGDRRTFVGVGGDVTNPDAMRYSDLGGQFPPGGDACGAYQVHVDLPPGSEEQVVFILGNVGSRMAIKPIVERWRDTQFVSKAMRGVTDHWIDKTRSIVVKTPDASFDLMVNHWLIYQTVSSRLLARAGFYQAGGAFGFRDQLQDVLSLIPSDPQRVRQQILLAARHQFEQGDVLHWWHPPGGKGVRTRITDDRLWLPWVTARYIESTGDSSILDCEIPFLCAPDLQEGEHDRYSAYSTATADSLYEHCCRAMDVSMVLGSHGLPLMGSGDWNDGMDGVGSRGLGESVWLAWFQISTVDLLAPIVEQRGDTERADTYRHYAEQLKQAIDTHAWDGDWYIRAFDDDGVPWGAHTNEECRIDAIAQAWAAICGYDDEPNTLQALSSAKQFLIDEEHQLVKLLTPPFDKTTRNPGYIKAYPPGIRENGGQYSHAAAWLGLAFAQVREPNTAYQIFSMINPIPRSVDRLSAERYAREPYAVSADIGGVAPQAGRGGWSWYTGAAGWSYQLAVHGILGIHYTRAGVRIEPQLPDAWNEVEFWLRRDTGTIHVVVEKLHSTANSITSLIADGTRLESNQFEFPLNEHVREVRVVLD